MDTAQQRSALGVPPAALNGGLYTGQPFQPGAPWGNVPAAPDAAYYSFVLLPRTADPRPPPAAAFQVPHGNLNPGNNTPLRPGGAAGASARIASLNAVCVPAQAYASAPAVSGPAGAVRFREFAYL